MSIKLTILFLFNCYGDLIGLHSFPTRRSSDLSDELITRLDKYLGSPDFDPHGDPIPDEHGVLKRTSKKLLSELDKNQQGICVGVKESSAEFLQYLDKKGISIGTKITVLGKEFFDGSMVVEVGKGQFFISLKIADNLFVQTA